jgi:hypothetical protein
MTGLSDLVAASWTSLTAAAFMAIAGCGGSAGSAGPPEPPSGVHIETAPVWNHCVLAWTAPPQPVQGYEVTASVAGWTFSDVDGQPFSGADASGEIAPGTATRAELDFSQIRVQELSQIDIRIRSLDQSGQISQFAPAVSCVIAVKSPDEAAAVVFSAGIVVTWFNESSLATTIEVEKAALDATGRPGPWSVLATVPASPGDFTSFPQFDLDVAIGTAYAYRLTAVAPGGQRSPGTVATTAALGTPLTMSTVMLPASCSAVADGNGHYAFSSAGHTCGRNGPLRFTWGTGAPWMSSPSITATAYPPFVKLDAAGLPHAVYGTPMTSGGVTITHGWSDGAEWLEEPIAQRASAVSLQFDLDASGAPVMMWSLGDFPKVQFEAATKVDGAWTVKALDGVYSVDAGHMAFADATGAIHLFLGSDYDGITHIQFTGGAWTSEPVAPSKLNMFASPIVGAGRDVDHITLCFVTGNIIYTEQLSCVRKTPSGWGNPEPLGAVSMETYVDDTIAMSADGKRLAMLFQRGVSELFRSTDGGGWTDLGFPPLQLTAAPIPSLFLNFDASGKLFVLVNSTPGTDGTATTVEYRMSREP